MTKRAYRRTPGSPPQVRGKRRQVGQEIAVCRITPAGAGKTINRFLALLANIGSPPQVRGKRDLGMSLNCRLGITPAGAGKTGHIHRIRLRNRDHPRRCGENSPKSGIGGIVGGSPPQVRGKHTVYFMSSDKPRITPAGAGKTCYLLYRHSGFWDHPRRCGENTSCAAPCTVPPGSPPQVRGKPNPQLMSLPNARITPAGAGKTRSFLPESLIPTDHPRRCGENLLNRGGSNAILGSPPQVRGKQGEKKKEHYHVRITPAGAGKTKGRNIITSIDRDHPRRCGENHQLKLQRKKQTGSPPQVRGKPSRALALAAFQRITPADAGKTR